MSSLLVRFLLCAPSVFAVPLWLCFQSNSEPQRLREHRGNTEKTELDTMGPWTKLSTRFSLANNVVSSTFLFRTAPFVKSE